MTSRKTAGFSPCLGVPRAAFIMSCHSLLLLAERVQGVCRLNEQTVFDDPYDGMHGALVGLSGDWSRQGTFRAFTEYAVFK